jgi:CubicO group peptidase (beta-lactamase class C family)
MPAATTTPKSDTASTHVLANDEGGWMNPLQKQAHRAAMIISLAATVVAGIGPSNAQAAAPEASDGAWTIPSNEQIKRLLSERMQHNGVGIVVGIIELAGPRIVAHGRSGSPDARPLDGDTIFQIGSITKTFTTLLLADMVQRGEVKLDDPAAKYLPPGVKMPQLGRAITLKDLATHMSGLPSMPSNYDLQGKPTPYEAYTVEQLYQFLSGYRLEREPGTKGQYSNLGVALLGRLLAYRMGMEYEALLTERVLKPLGMESTAIKLTSAQSRRLAPGHDRYLQPVAPWEMASLPASGSLRSTANDMLKFISAYVGPSSPLKAATAFQTSVRQPVSSGMVALSWAVRQSGADEIYAHDGGKEGYRSGVVFNPKSGRGVVVLANARTDDLPMSIAVHLLTGRPLSTAPPAPAAKARIAVDRKVLDTYAGRYQAAPDQILTVARSDDHLLVEIGGSGGIGELHATGPRDFFLITGNDEIAFQVDAAGRIAGLTHYGDGKDAGKGKFAPRINGD